MGVNSQWRNQKVRLKGDENATAVYGLFCVWCLPEGLEFHQQMSEYTVACLATLSTEILVIAGTMEPAMTSLSVLPVELWYLVFSLFPIGCYCRKWHCRVASSLRGLTKLNHYHTGTATNREQDGLGNSRQMESGRVRKDLRVLEERVKPNTTNTTRAPASTAGSSAAADKCTKAQWREIQYKRSQKKNVVTDSILNVCKSPGPPGPLVNEIFSRQSCQSLICLTPGKRWKAFQRSIKSDKWQWEGKMVAHPWPCYVRPHCRIQNAKISGLNSYRSKWTTLKVWMERFWKFRQQKGWIKWYQVLGRISSQQRQAFPGFYISLHFRFKIAKGRFRSEDSWLGFADKEFLFKGGLQLSMFKEHHWINWIINHKAVEYLTLNCTSLCVRSRTQSCETLFWHVYSKGPLKNIRFHFCKKLLADGMMFEVFRTRFVMVTCFLFLDILDIRRTDPEWNREAFDIFHQ